MGTGERQELDFIGTRDCEKNRFYVLKDADPLEIEPAIGRPYDDSTNLENADNLSGGCNVALPSNKIGYYVEGVHGEKFTTDTSIFFGKVLTGSFVPTASSDECTAAGDAYLYGFDLFCGAGAFEQPDVNGDMQPTRAVHIGTGLPNEPRVSVGSPKSGAGGGGDCEDMVLVITSDSEGFMDCPGGRPDSGIKVKSWRDR